MPKYLIKYLFIYFNFIETIFITEWSHAPGMCAIIAHGWNN